MKKGILFSVIFAVLMAIAVPAKADNYYDKYLGQHAVAADYVLTGNGCEAIEWGVSVQENLMNSTNSSEHTLSVHVYIQKFDACLGTPGTVIIDQTFSLNPDADAFEMTKLDTARLETVIETVDNNGDPLVIPISLQWKGIGDTEITPEVTKNPGYRYRSIDAIRRATTIGNVGDFIIDNQLGTLEEYTYTRRIKLQ